MERLKTLEELRLERATKRVKEIKGFYNHLITYLLVNTFLVLSNYFGLDEGETFLTFSTFSVPFFWGIGLFFHVLNVFGRNVFLGPDWEEKKIKELMEKKHETRWE